MCGFDAAVPYMGYGFDDIKGTYGWSRVQLMGETHFVMNSRQQ